MNSVQKIKEMYPDEELLFLEGFDDCILGTVYGIGLPVLLACYDAEKVVQRLMRDNDMKRDDAVEFFEFNIAGAYFGDRTPVFLEMVEGG